jgi:hypothetical protein
MRKLVFILLLPIGLYAQELIGTYSADTSVYLRAPSYGIWGPGDYIETGLNDYFWLNGTDLLSLYQKKGSDQYDIFSFFGKIGSMTIPSLANARNYWIIFSQTLINADTNFECIVNFQPNNNVDTTYSFKVFDNKGNQLLSDKGVAGYGFDGQNTYIISLPLIIEGNRNYTWKIWKFRSNISSRSKSLSKTAATHGPMMTYMPSGDLRVNLQPVSGGTSIQIFDMLGRQLFNETIQNINKPTTINIPASGMPNSPFVAKVNNSNGSYIKKGMPAR